MTDPKYTHLTLVVDRSGSMAGIQLDAQGALNAFLADQRAQPGRLTVTLVQFDHETQTVHDFTPIGDVPPYVLKPRGGTALLDAVDTAIDSTGAHLAALPEEARPANVLLAVVTDGHENLSTKATLPSVRAKIEHQRDVYGWAFAFLGADDSAWAGRALGVDSTMMYARNPAGTRDAYRQLSTGTSNLRGGGGFTLPTDATKA